MNGDDYRISTLDTLEHAIHTLRMRKVNGSLTKEESNRLESLVEKGLDVLGLDSEEAAEPVTQEIQENKCAEGSSSACPLVVEDGNRKTLMGYGPSTYVLNRASEEREMRLRDLKSQRDEYIFTLHHPSSLAAHPTIQCL